jgi:RNA polymerase sigma-70 factor (ECF subfamily)
VRDAAEDELDAWMARLADGDRTTFDPLFRALYPRALRVARARVEPERAEDVAQASLVKLFAAASTFERGRPVLPWLYAIVANEIRAEQRAAARTGEPLEAAAHIAGGADTERAVADTELARALDVAIAALDAPSAEAIAALLGRTVAPPIAPAAFRKRVSRAVARLRVLLGGTR